MSHLTDDLRVMVVDDDPTWLAMMKEALNKDGIQNMIVDNALDVFASVNIFKPNIILQDIHMPYISGVQVISELIANPKHRNIAIAMVTAAKNADELLFDVRSHVVNIYHKPIPVGKLMRDILIRHFCTGQIESGQKLRLQADMLSIKYGNSNQL